MLIKGSIVLFCVFIIFLCLNKKEKVAVSILIFTISIDFFNPFRFLGLSNDIYIDVNGLIIWMIWICRKISFRRKVQRNTVGLISTKILYFFLFFGLLLGYINFDTIGLLDKFSIKEWSVSTQILNVSLWILTIILFLNILIEYRDDTSYHLFLIRVFMFSIFVHLITDIFGSFLFFRPLEVTNFSIDSDRRAGLLNGGEVIVDYCLIVISFSMIAYNKFKYSSILVLVAAIIVGLFTGSRSFIVIISLFVSIFLFMNSYINGFNLKTIKYFIVSFVSLLFIYFFFIDYLLSLTIFIRLTDSISLLNNGEYIAATNRDMEGIPVVFEKINVLGGGAGYFNHVDGHQMVSHNILLAMYAKYGIIGLFSIIYLFYISLKSLFDVIKSKINATLCKDALILFSLLLSLFFQEQKISCIRYLTPMLFYEFLFIVIYFKYYSFIKLRKYQLISGSRNINESFNRIILR